MDTWCPSLASQKSPRTIENSKQNKTALLSSEASEAASDAPRRRLQSSSNSTAVNLRCKRHFCVAARQRDSKLPTSLQRFLVDSGDCAARFGSRRCFSSLTWRKAQKATCKLFIIVGARIYVRNSHYNRAILKTSCSRSIGCLLLAVAVARVA